VQTSEASFNCSFKDFSISEAVTTGENLETKCALDRIFLATIEREDKLGILIMLALRFLAETVGRLENYFTIRPLLFVVTIVKPSLLATRPFLIVIKISYSSADSLTDVVVFRVPELTTSV
jgi:hypothetical protein